MDKLQKIIKLLPHQPGCYIYSNDKSKIIYVGKAKDLKKRVSSYFTRSAKDAKTTVLVSKIADISTIVTNSEVEALLLEDSLIKKHKPLYNIDLKDDKRYPYFRLSVDEAYPRLSIVRQKKKDGAKYFGPYAGSIRESLKTLNQIFQLRKCTYANLNKIKKHCLYYDIGQCLAPCVFDVKKEYLAEEEAISKFLLGSHKELIKRLKEKMDLHSKRLEYEQAGAIRDKLQTLQKVINRQNVIAPDKLSRDIWFFLEDPKFMIAHVLYMQNGRIIGSQEYSAKVKQNFDESYFERLLMSHYQYQDDLPSEIVTNINVTQLLLKYLKQQNIKLMQPKSGFRAELLQIAKKNARKILHEKLLLSGSGDGRHIGLEKLKHIFNLDKLPHRIDCFDISNIQGSDTVAAMTVLRDGKPDKASYRKYIIDQDTPNDFAAMEEVLTRRYYKVMTGEAEAPDLTIVDGGKGQLSMAVRVMKKFKLDIPLVGIAKREEELFVPGRSNPIILKKSDPALKLIQQVRDEAHRFAVTFHKNRRKKRFFKSELADIPGVGPATQHKLLKKFGSVEKVKAATPKALADIVNSKQAQAIVEYYARGKE